MKAHKFYEVAEEFLDDCMEIMKSKGMAYSGTDDKFGNFKRVAKNLSMTPEQVWFVYFSKHFDSLSAYIRGEYSDSEPIKGRIMDMVNYLLLLNGLIVEGEGEIEQEMQESLEGDDDWTDFDAPPFHGKIKVVETDGEEKNHK